MAHMPLYCIKITMRIWLILDTTWTEYTWQEYHVLNPSKQHYILMIMGWRNVPTSEYDHMAIIYHVIYTYHILYCDNRTKKKQFSLDRCKTSDMIQ